MTNPSGERPPDTEPGETYFIVDKATIDFIKRAIGEHMHFSEPAQELEVTPPATAD